MFRNKIVVITGGAGGIGKCIADQFRNNGAEVCVIDTAEGDHYVGDIGSREVLEAFAETVIEKYGRVDVLVNNAPPAMIGIDNCSYEQFQQALAVGVTAPFYLSKLFAPYFGEGASIINLSSSRDRMSQPQSESYTAAKGGISALTHGLAVSFAGKVRVNSVRPAGLIRSTGSMKVRMPCSSRQDGWEIPWMLQTWCCSWLLKRQGSSPVRISALTAVRPG